MLEINSKAGNMEEKKHDCLHLYIGVVTIVFS